MRKGLSSFVSHILALAISIIILSIIASNLFGYYRDTVEQSQRTQTRIVGGEIGQNIIRLYTNYRGSEVKIGRGEDLVLGKIKLSIPQKISGRSYIIELQDNDEEWIEANVQNGVAKDTERQYAGIEVRTMASKPIVETYYLNNIGIELEGKVRKTDEILLKYIRENFNGTLEDKIVMERL